MSSYYRTNKLSTLQFIFAGRKKDNTQHYTDSPTDTSSTQKQGRGERTGQTGITIVRKVVRVGYTEVVYKQGLKEMREQAMQQSVDFLGRRKLKG